MKKFFIRDIRGIIIITALFVFTAVLPARAQIIVSKKILKVVKTEAEKGRIVITRKDYRPDNAMGYVYVDHKTVITRNGKPFPWTKLKKGWIIMVRGGVRLDMNVRAVKIEVLKSEETLK